MNKTPSTKPESKPAASIGEEFDMSAIELCLATGELGKLQPAQRLNYLAALCSSLKLNPLTRPFEFMAIDGKLCVYAKKDCADQLRARDKVSLEIMSREEAGGTYTVVARATTPDGRKDEAIGSVSICYPDQKKTWLEGRWSYGPHPRAGQSFIGEERANAMMKAETKAKRRATLSICGLGLPDEDEARTIIEAETVREQERMGSEPLTDDKREMLDAKALELAEAASEETDDAKRKALHDKAIALERMAQKPEPEGHKQMMAEARAAKEANQPEPKAEPKPYIDSNPESDKGEKINWRVVVIHTGNASGPLGKTVGELMDVEDISVARGWHKYLMRHFTKLAGKKLTIKDQVLLNAIDAGLGEMEARENASMASSHTALQVAESKSNSTVAGQEESGRESGAGDDELPGIESLPSSKPTETEDSLFGSEIEQSITSSWRDVTIPAGTQMVKIVGKRIGELGPKYIFGIQAQAIEPGLWKEKMKSDPDLERFCIAHALAYREICGGLGEQGGGDELLKIVTTRLRLMGRGTVDTARQLFAQLVVMKIIQSDSPLRGFADCSPEHLRAMLLRWDDVQQIHEALVKAQK